MYRYEMGKYDVDSLLSFSSAWYKNIRAEKVPIELSWFDKLTDSIVLYLKQNKITPAQIFTAVGSVVVVVLLLIIVCKCLGKTKANNNPNVRMSLESKEFYKHD